MKQPATIYSKLGIKPNTFHEATRVEYIAMICVDRRVVIERLAMEGTKVTEAQVGDQLNPGDKLSARMPPWILVYHLEPWGHVELEDDPQKEIDQPEKYVPGRPQN